MVATSKSLEIERPVLCRVSEAAAYLTLSRSSIYGLMDAGRLPYVKLGRSRRIKWADVLNLVEQHTVGGDGAHT
jgi:excisionase family DNA binding protein